MKVLRNFLIPGIAAVLAISLAIPAFAQPDGDQGNPNQGQAGTSLIAEKTATGFWIQDWIYDWQIVKSVDPEELTLEQGETDTVTYTIVTTRGDAEFVEGSNVFGVYGTITVTNNGDRETEGLTIVDQVEYKVGPGQFKPLGDPVVIEVNEELPAGATKTYEYSITFTPEEDAVYRNSVQVTITNHSGHLGNPFGPNPKVDFALPSEPTINYIDEEATVSDEFTDLDGFTVVPSDVGPWTVTSSDTITFTATITNVSADEGTFNLTNTATLVTNDTETVADDDAEVVITVSGGAGGGDEEPGDGQGLSPGFWKNHTEVWVGYAADTTLGSVFGLGDFGTLGANTFLDALNFGGSGENGAAKTLLRQAVAALLNVAYFEDYGMTAEEIIDAVNAALTSGDTEELKDDLDDGNNQGGEIEDSGPANPTPGYEKDKENNGKGNGKP
jgi:hypothetical protein